MTFTIRNWEVAQSTGAAIVGATVSLQAASTAHPNPNAVLATTSTDPNGMWEFTALDDANTYDVKVEWSGRVKWYKGLSRFTHELQNKQLKGITAILDSNARNVLTFVGGAGAGGNYLEMQNASAGASPVLRAVGGDANVNLTLAAKGTASVVFHAGGADRWRVHPSGWLQRQLAGVGLWDENGAVLLDLVAQASAVNYVQVANAPLGGDPQLNVAGANANISLRIIPKGSGWVHLWNGVNAYALVGDLNAGVSQRVKQERGAAAMTPSTAWTDVYTVPSPPQPTFIVAYSATPVVLGGGPTTANITLPSIYSVSTIGFTFNCLDVGSGTSRTPTWIAIGTF
jgi:hypothetical protein